MSTSLPSRPSALPAILFEPDGYVLDGPKLMGRQAAGNGFLRAAIHAAEQSVHKGGPSGLLAYTPHSASAQAFSTLVSRQAPSVKPSWIPADRLDLLTNQGVLYVPGPGIGESARLRLRAGPAAWSISGVTHTLCSHTAMDAITDLLAAPVMPWDALICTSSVAKQAVSTLFELQAQYFAWRFGVKQFSIPQLPVIPFGVHTQDFGFDETDKQRARVSVHAQADEVVALFAGRLSFHAKAHPYPMLLALQTAAQRTGQKVHLLLCGQFPNDAVKEAFLSSASRYAPSIRTQWVDGKSFEAYRNAWAASDLFISLSDNLQETFGITPIEAMSSGLPVLVSDWDGYKDTVVDGETGFRIPTWMPPPDLGSALAAAFEAGSINYDRYIGLACLDVSLDHRQLVDRLADLLASPARRAEMGAAGRRRVQTLYDWQVVMQQHMMLWQSLDDLRQQAIKDQHPALKQAPSCDPARQDPYRIFGGFPTQRIRGETIARSLPGDRPITPWQNLLNDKLFQFATSALPKTQQVDAILSELAKHPGGISLSSLGQRLGWSLAQTIKTAAPLAKTCLIELRNDSGDAG